MSLQDRLALRARGKAPSPIRELVPLMKLPGMISLGGGYPNPETFVFERFDVTFTDGTKIALEGEALTGASQYGPSECHPDLVEPLLAWHAHKDGVSLDRDGVVTLNGSQEGLFIAAYCFLERDDSVVVSEPTYPGALASFRSFCKNFVEIPLDSRGMDTAALELRLESMKAEGKRLPKLVYVIPNGHNPGGVALSVERRHHLVELAKRFDLLVLEDDPYQLVRFDESDPPVTLQRLAPEHVLRLDSFSKIFAPGLRIGYASGPAEIIRQFVLFKQGSNLHTSSFVQALLAAYLREVGNEGFRALITRNCLRYREHRNAMLEAATEFLPDTVRWDVPTEGMFIWFRLPESVDAGKMIESHTKDDLVLLVPGGAFSTVGGCKNCLRASYSMVPPDRLREGMRRFAGMLEKTLNPKHSS